MKKTYLVLIVIGILVILMALLRFNPFDLSGEDSWIKDEKGQYVKHGFPYETPDYVQEQQEAVLCAEDLYEQKKQEGMVFASQCLGTCDDYAVDVVHVPRSSEDNLAENQCEDYRSGKVKHFIELDEEGEVVKIV